MPTEFLMFRRRTWRQQAAATAIIAVILTILFAVLYPHDHSAGVGVLVGGGSVLAFCVIALWRNRHHAAPHGIERVLGGGSDERDKALVLNSFAVGGWCALAVMPAQVIALTFHANPMITCGIALAMIIVSMVTTWMVLSRRM